MDDRTPLRPALWLPRHGPRRLDHLEGFRPDGPRHYECIVVEADPLVGGEPVRAWCYIYTPSRIDQSPGASLLGSGDWRPSAQLP